LCQLDERPDEYAPYVRLLGDAMIGKGARFATERPPEATLQAVDPVLAKQTGTSRTAAGTGVCVTQSY
jgi:hypothetical protein